MAESFLQARLLMVSPEIGTITTPQKPNFSNTKLGWTCSALWALRGQESC
uniref:Uncharacterized protein n=1 Tax=Rhizophora mucronata TaxID=61149 RepID=A0A2P2NRF2_RHIMU